MYNENMRHLTTRSNADGTKRFYFLRRGTPISRLPDPASPTFGAVYSDLLAASENANIAYEDRALDGYRRHWAEYLWKKARYRANRVCSITPDDILAKIRTHEDCCALSGIRFQYRRNAKGRDPLAPSLDRIDSRGGYTVENCRVVLLAVNIGLNEWGDETFQKICKAVAKRKLVRPSRSAMNED